MKFTTKSSFYTISGFNQSHSGPSNDPPKRYIQKRAGSYTSEKPINIASIDEVHLKCDCINRSIVNGVRDPILFSFALDN